LLVVLASTTDLAARHLVARLRDAALVTPQDLTTAGWRHWSHQGEGSLAVAGQIVRVTDVTGVITRLPCIFAEELVSIIPPEREYVAAEMTAFLAAWLADLRCPVLNQPTAASLWGPPMHPEGWVHLAWRSGIPVVPITTRAGCRDQPPGLPAAPQATVVVVGDRVLAAHPGGLEGTRSRAVDAGDSELARHARRLAAATEVELLCVRFGVSAGQHAFLSADYLPDVSDVEIVAALASRLGAEVT
jgi:hypothetical protein